MEKAMKHIIYSWAAVFIFCLSGCADEITVDKPDGEGVLLNMYIGTEEANTRLAELGSDFITNINTENREKKNIGLYIYYEDDYKENDLSKPYIRNLECYISEENKLTPMNNEQIYIYDRMTIVAFYPYNADMSESKNYFKKTADEEAYPITESNYAEQTYIPYRAETNVNPTNAYMTRIIFTPKHTCKFEVVLVADETNKFPASENMENGSIKIVPSIDMYDGAYDAATGDRREKWLDGITDFTNTGGGMNVRRYTAYVWKSSKNDKHHDDHKHHDNKLEKGDILFQSEELTLLMPVDFDFGTETVYRYGYNLNTGEVFIPTSDRLAYDAESLQNISFSNYRAYQVCDIDLSNTSWIPLTTYNGTYDGGGHKIKGLKYTIAPNANVDNAASADGKHDKQAFGLFSEITGTSTLMNIDLASPEITVDYSNPTLKDTCYVGALCGLVNPELSDAKKEEIIGKGLPPGLSETVKKALIADGMKNFGSTTCYVRGCKVSNPKITVKGENVRVGALLGGAGNQKQKAEIKDSYAWQDEDNENAIAVNAENETDKKTYETAYVSGFCGMLSNGKIENSYSNLTRINGYVKETVPPTTVGESETVTSKDIATGFCNFAPEGERITDNPGTISDCFSKKADTAGGVINLATSHPSAWPLFKDDTTVSNRTGLGGTSAWPAYKWTDSWKELGAQGATYPRLIWESPLIIEYQ